MLWMSSDRCADGFENRVRRGGETAALRELRPAAATAAETGDEGREELLGGQINV